MTYMSEDTLRKLVFSFHYVGPGDPTQVIRLGGSCLLLLSHHAILCLLMYFLKKSSKNISEGVGEVTQQWLLQRTHFNSQQPYPPIIPVPEDPVPSPGSTSTKHIGDAHTYIQAKYTYIPEIKYVNLKLFEMNKE